MIPPRTADPVLAVTGVSADEILERCGEVRAGRGGEAPRARSRSVVAGSRRLLDLADLSDADFVHEVHRVLLNRSPAPFEFERRQQELRAGTSRMEITVRLALSPEGRRSRRPLARGFGFNTLAKTAGLIEAAERNALLALTTKAGERATRASLARHRSHRWIGRAAGLGAIGVAAVAADRTFRNRRARRFKDS
jgi:hypothetical protein